MDLGSEVCGIDPARFILFCEKLKIPAKDDPFGNAPGEILRPLKLFRPQIYLLSEILSGLRDDIHLFWVLKCRQSGASTFGFAWDLYWAFQHAGMILTMINPDTQLQTFNRNLVSSMVGQLNLESPEWGLPVVTDNVGLLAFSNRSQIVWLNANSTKKEAGLARGIGVIGTHGTELGEWKDRDAVNSWFAALSKRNPNRFYLLEGTSKGPGLFKDYWISYAEEELGGKSIFIGWWLHPLYDLNLKDKTHKKIYENYWASMPRLTRDESHWFALVKERYGYEVSTTQIAWWRYMWKKEYQGNLSMLYQEYPPLPEYAWSYGSKGYVNAASIIVQKANSREAKRKQRYFKFEYGTRFEHTQFSEIDPNKDFWDLVLWEDPRVDDENCRYIISLDPAHGANENSDLAVVEIFRAYADKCVQVGEFAMRDLPSYALAWVILELAGIYHCETRLCIELQGGGYSTNDELQRLILECEQGYDPKLVAHFERLQHYEYYRPDSRRRTSATYHWITSGKSKEIMLSRYRDHFERGILVIRSPELIKETQDTITDSDGDFLPSEDDNRLMAAALAVMAYLQTVEYEIGADPNFLKEASDAREAKEKDGPTPANYLQALQLDWKEKLVAKMEDEEQERKALQEKMEDGDWKQNYDIDSQRRYYP